MTDDKKTLKFQMMMSPSEANELDDWMFKNRIRSRAEAIRRLCQIGLVVDQEADNLATTIVELVKSTPEALSKNKTEFYKNVENGAELIEEINKYMDKSGHTDIELIGELYMLLHSINLILAPIKAYRSNDDFEAAKDKATISQNSIRKKMEEFVTDLAKIEIPNDKKSIYVKTKKD